MYVDDAVEATAAPVLTAPMRLRIGAQTGAQIMANMIQANRHSYQDAIIDTQIDIILEALQRIGSRLYDIQERSRE
jgi:hypothetical protein